MLPCPMRRFFPCWPLFIASFGQSKAESRQDRSTSHRRCFPTDFHEQQGHMSVQATNMSAIKFVRSVSTLPALRLAVIRKLMP